MRKTKKIWWTRLGLGLWWETGPPLHVRLCWNNIKMRFQHWSNSNIRAGGSHKISHTHIYPQLWHKRSIFQARGQIAWALQGGDGLYPTGHGEILYYGQAVNFTMFTALSAPVSECYVCQRRWSSDMTGLQSLMESYIVIGPYDRHSRYDLPLESLPDLSTPSHGSLTLTGVLLSSGLNRVFHV